MQPYRQDAPDDRPDLEYPLNHFAVMIVREKVNAEYGNARLDSNLAEGS